MSTAYSLAITLLALGGAAVLFALALYLGIAALNSINFNFHQEDSRHD